MSGSVFNISKTLVQCSAFKSDPCGQYSVVSDTYRRACMRWYTSRIQNCSVQFERNCFPFHESVSQCDGFALLVLFTGLIHRAHSTDINLSQVTKVKVSHLSWSFRQLYDFQVSYRHLAIWTSSWDYGTYYIGDQRRLSRACAVSSEPSLFAHMKNGSRQRVRPKIRHLASLDGCACAFE